MTFERAEDSTEHASPTTLFEFRLGPNAGDVFRYTDADEDVFHEEEKWDKEPIEYSSIQQDGSLNKAKVVIGVPQDNDLVRIFLRRPPSFVVTIRVLEGHFDDPDRDFIQIFAGRVLSCQSKEALAELTCEPASTSLKRVGLRRNYQRQCPHVLYQQGPGLCNAVRTAIPCSVDFAAGNVVRAVPGAPLGDVEAYAGGVMEWTNASSGRTEIRTILRTELDGPVAVFVLAGPANDIAGGLTITKGCAHTEQACADWHGNIVNFGGQPWVPFKNPFNTLREFM